MNNITAKMLADRDKEIEDLRRDVELLERRCQRYHAFIMRTIRQPALTLKQAKELDLCRICGAPPTVPLILNGGQEYACEKCLKETSK